MIICRSSLHAYMHISKYPFCEPGLRVSPCCVRRSSYHPSSLGLLGWLGIGVSVGARASRDPENPLSGAVLSCKGQR